MSPEAGRRVRRRARWALGLALGTMWAAPAQAAPGPKYTEAEQSRLAAIQCYGDTAGAPRGTVLLVHGTTVTAEENWSITYRPVLLDRGHGVCEVTLPNYAFGDVQTTVEYVATAIEETARRSGRKISILGHSQGAFQPLFAVRIWPHLAEYVDDFIGLAGVYDRGSEAVDCSQRPPCAAAYRQMTTGSALLTALGRRRLPDGPSYTAIGTLKDATVTPQPQANQLPAGGGRRTEVQIQDICPGRQMPAQDHIFMAGDAVAYELVLDALDHPGPANPDRVNRTACNKVFFDGVDLAGFGLIAPRIFTRQKPHSDAEPALRCFLRPECTDLDGRGRVLSAARVSTRKHAATLRLTAEVAGKVKVTLRRHGKRRVVRRRALDLSPGSRTLRLATRLQPGSYTITIEAVPDAFSAFAAEAHVRFRVR